MSACPQRIYPLRVCVAKIAQFFEKDNNTKKRACPFCIDTLSSLADVFQRLTYPMYFISTLGNALSSRLTAKEY